MPKFLEDEKSLQYKKNLSELMTIVNPKPPIEVLERLLKRYEDQRTAHTNKFTS
ncbi:hypothetical protein V7111_07325 [Neobacillus niacini]|uniref:hypothetical protein n=1 Tax=Neobacillus niacini TaxID=86668 RepID=UPI002FFF7C41